jgi:hypothetical protein
MRSFLCTVRLLLLCLNQLLALAGPILRFIRCWCYVVDGRWQSFAGSGERAESIMQMMREQTKNADLVPCPPLEWRATESPGLGEGPQNCQRAKKESHGCLRQCREQAPLV